MKNNPSYQSMSDTREEKSEAKNGVTQGQAAIDCFKGCVILGLQTGVRLMEPAGGCGGSIAGLILAIACIDPGLVKGCGEVGKDLGRVVGGAVGGTVGCVGGIVSSPCVAFFPAIKPNCCDEINQGPVCEKMSDDPCI